MEIVSPIISSAISFALGKAYNWIAERKNKKAVPAKELLSLLQPGGVNIIPDSRKLSNHSVILCR